MSLGATNLSDKAVFLVLIPVSRSSPPYQGQALARGCWYAPVYLHPLSGLSLGKGALPLHPGPVVYRKMVMLVIGNFRKIKPTICKIKPSIGKSVRSCDIKLPSFAPIISNLYEKIFHFNFSSIFFHGLRLFTTCF
jgi:hypothetical protein